MPPVRSRRATAVRAALALGLGAAILGLLLAHLPIAQAFEWSLYDLRMRRTIAPAGAPKRMAILPAVGTLVKAAMLLRRTVP